MTKPLRCFHLHTKQTYTIQKHKNTNFKGIMLTKGTQEDGKNRRIHDGKRELNVEKCVIVS